MQTTSGVAIPHDLQTILIANPDLRAIFESMRPSCQKKYIAWVHDGKEEGTHLRRLQRFPELLREYAREHPETQTLDARKTIARRKAASVKKVHRPTRAAPPMMDDVAE